MSVPDEKADSVRTIGRSRWCPKKGSLFRFSVAKLEHWETFLATFWLVVILYGCKIPSGNSLTILTWSKICWAQSVWIVPAVTILCIPLSSPNHFRSLFSLLKSTKMNNFWKFVSVVSYLRPAAVPGSPQWVFNAKNQQKLCIGRCIHGSATVQGYNLNLQLMNLCLATSVHNQTKKCANCFFFAQLFFWLESRDIQLVTQETRQTSRSAI